MISSVLSGAYEATHTDMYRVVDPFTAWLVKLDAVVALPDDVAMATRWTIFRRADKPGRWLMYLGRGE